MNDWNRLLVILDKTIGFPNKIRSSVKKKWQGYDQRTGEHVFVLEYRIKVKPGIEPPAKMPQTPRDLHTQPPVKPNKPVRPTGSMSTIRELMDVRFVNTVDSSPSPPSPKNNKATTAKSGLRLKRIRPKSPASPIRPA